MKTIILVILLAVSQTALASDNSQSASLQHCEAVKELWRFSFNSYYQDPSIDFQGFLKTPVGSVLKKNEKMQVVASIFIDVKQFWLEFEPLRLAERKKMLSSKLDSIVLDCIMSEAK